MMHRSNALVIMTRQLNHVCPYRGQSVPVALCYKRSQDIEERDYCYACDYVPVLKRKFGLRTFKRKIVLSKCLHCDEAPSLHEAEAPHRCVRVTTCPGYEPQQDSGTLYVATNTECTEWMTVDVATGVRRPFSETKGKRYKLPLVGALGTVAPDARDEERQEAADQAARRRSGNRKQDEDAPGFKPARGRRKQTK
jgi:hypothetical protein